MLAREIDVVRQRFGLKNESRVVSCFEEGRDGFRLHHALTALARHELRGRLGK